MSKPDVLESHGGDRSLGFDVSGLEEILQVTFGNADRAAAESNAVMVQLAFLTPHIHDGSAAFQPLNNSRDGQ